MSVLVDNETRLCVSGITGREGTFHAMNNRRYGTQVVSGVTPGKEGQKLLAEANLPNVHIETTMDGAAAKVVEVAAAS